MTSRPARPGDLPVVGDDADRRARLAQLDARVRKLEQQRLGARSARARLVALDVELCRMEAARRMLVPAAVTEPEPSG